MERIKLKDRDILDYTKGEEIFSMVTHIVGAGLSLVGMVLCIIFAAIRGNTLGVISSIIFGISSMFVYIMSSLFHGINKEKIAKKVFQVLDKCSIFLFVAGIYTLFILCVILEKTPALGWILFGLTWGTTVIGITLNAINFKMFKVISIICYVILGILGIIETVLLIGSLKIIGIILLLVGIFFLY